MTDILSHYGELLSEIQQQGLYKRERVITTPQRTHITTRESGEVLNFCANNYLGLADNPEIIAAARQALDDHGFGMASVRFICGTQDLHKELERTIAGFLGTDDAILYSSCFDANTGLFETLLCPDDAVISDQLNHASIIDGVRLCKAQRLRYSHGDMNELEDRLKESRNARTRLVVTDGVFSMDGDLAKLDRIVELAQRYDALVMVDDSHATGVMGKTGRGSAEHFGVMEHIDIYTSTLGKALGGGTGGFTAARQNVVDLLRQRSRPYLFSNSIAPPVAAAGRRALELIAESTQLRDRLLDNTRYFRQQISSLGFDIREGETPIVPVMLYDAALASSMADQMLSLGIYVIGFSYPVVPKDKARIRVQLSAAHTRPDLDRAIDAFAQAGRKLGIIR